MAVEAPARILDGIRAHDLIADAHTLTTEDTILVVAHKEGIVVLVERAGDLGVEAGLVDAKFIGILLQIAGAVGLQVTQ